ncbi:hypothetical protein MLD38_002572 [Melastoma candidum]|uniref:Uncharacterized protein n=1 Tax=Melastoma candidum TaxID=119954 RepID=A0ACB9S455_9MYRT|nr:hypothetical protein MLD38_002572 [Melastoma candidum]
MSSAWTFHPTILYKERKLEFKILARFRSESLFISVAPSTGPNRALFILPITTRPPILTRKPGAVPEDKNISLSLDEDGEEAGDVKKKGTIAGAVALIIGTSIGSGILALPQRAAPAGIVPSSVCMVTCWAFLLIEALLLVEVNTSLWKRRRRGKEEDGDELGVISIRTMAQDTLGEWGGTLATVAYVFLGYTTMVAYCSKSGEILCDLINVPAPLSGVFFTVAFGLLISTGGTSATDRVNKFLTAAMIGLLVAIEIVAVASGGWSGDVRSGDWAKVPATIPVMIFSLVYHDVAPVICAYLDGDLTRIRNSVLIGSLVPLMALLVWDAIALSQSGNAEPLADPVLLLVRGGWSGVSTMVEAFSLLAVGTSLIGTLLGFSEFFKEQLANLQSPIPKAGTSRDASPSKNQQDRKKSSLLPVALVVCPSLLVSTSVPDAFSAATDIAGGYCMTMLYGVLPPAMAWAMRRRRGGGKQGIRTELMVGSGVFAVALVLEQFAQDFTRLKE